MTGRFSPFDSVEPLTEGIDFSDFDCGDEDFNEFIRIDALKDMRENLSVTFVGLRNERPVAYVSLVAAAYNSVFVDADPDKRYSYRNYPAVKIARIATEKRSMNRGFGGALVEYSMYIVLFIRRFVGCKMIITDAMPERISWYQKFGFKVSVKHADTPGHKTYPMHAILPS